MAAPSQRRALGVLFLALTVLFAGIAVAAASAALDEPSVWVIAGAAAALATWLATLALRGTGVR
jgi:hypothetical protein